MLVAWAGIKQEDKDTLINDHLAAIERLVQNPEGSETTARSPNTTVDDLARIIHLLKDPRLSAIWTGAHTPLTVAELDREVADRRDYWGEIVDAFNDYVQYKYQNIMYQNN